VLNHTAGLQNALSNDLKSDPLLMCNWDESLKKLAEATPESLPGEKQVYHALSFGWLCGGIIEVPTSELSSSFFPCKMLSQELFICRCAYF
jgi:CubicO group peptidase (beta-lactamase class C family)